jgi:hypothetical protein
LRDAAYLPAEPRKIINNDADTEKKRTHPISVSLTAGIQRWIPSYNARKHAARNTLIMGERLRESVAMAIATTRNDVPEIRTRDIMLSGWGMSRLRMLCITDGGWW